MARIPGWLLLGMLFFCGLAHAQTQRAQTPGQGRTRRASAPEPSRGEPQEGALARMALTSWSFRSGQEIPVVHTCDGGDRSVNYGAQEIVSPPLLWDDVPQGTASFVLF